MKPVPLTIVLLAAACASAPAPSTQASVPEADARQTSGPETAGACERDEELLARVAAEIHVNPERILPWVVPLTAEQVATVSVEDERLVVPREGNEWVACVTRNDILWTPLAPVPAAFARRVLAIEPEGDRVVLQTRNARLNELFR